jgi:hypothetical protein
MNSILFFLIADVYFVVVPPLYSQQIRLSQGKQPTSCFGGKPWLCWTDHHLWFTYFRKKAKTKNSTTIDATRVVNSLDWEIITIILTVIIIYCGKKP